ncbi:adenine nucleotide alpha hydrolases-like protein [Aaosphaeria arxii CBS 175.79]|uniref:FAD synthase n=1 Tax=Aaosphaeria arxii CBS 175.79 TaxID=1450172 RepID=A0A6A5XAG5_9PLEO|nr:adenine nucleotide alpha hydrolases-like protein [Aaosphaeria arxii CBS 175.79]KAF2009910.1 adenine nucleotide alpha hydrolases-like protein [Aaosphaeria arxii CBS 175.79]
MTAPAAGDLVNAIDRTSPLVTDTPLPLSELCASINDRVTTFLELPDPSPRIKAVQEQTRIALGVISDALDRYSLKEVSLAYNGGKDCLVLLVLYHCALHRKGLTTKSTSTDTHEPIQSVYIQSEHPFEEVEEFVALSVKQYSLSLLKYPPPMKAAFANYLHDQPQVKAIFVGTRRTDPHGEHLKHFDPTDHGWPTFVRIHPVIDWHYVDIWTFIRHINIPYCVLYDRGYTSLGGTTDTHPNPALARQISTSEVPTLDSSNGGAVNGSRPVKFRPAYELVDDYEERLGRDR